MPRPAPGHPQELPVVLRRVPNGRRPGDAVLVRGRECQVGVVVDDRPREARQIAVAGSAVGPTDRTLESPARARSSVGERSLHTREVAGSKPAAPIQQFRRKGRPHPAGPRQLHLRGGVLGKVVDLANLAQPPPDHALARSKCSATEPALVVPDLKGEAGPGPGGRIRPDHDLLNAGRGCAATAAPSTTRPVPANRPALTSCRPARRSRRTTRSPPGRGRGRARFPTRSSPARRRY